MVGRLFVALARLRCGVDSLVLSGCETRVVRPLLSVYKEELYNCQWIVKWQSVEVTLDFSTHYDLFSYDILVRFNAFVLWS